METGPNGVMRAEYLITYDSITNRYMYIGRVVPNGSSVIVTCAHVDAERTQNSFLNFLQNELKYLANDPGRYPKRME